MSAGFIYAIKAGDFIKIGFSTDPMRRFVKIQADNPYKCKLLGVLEGTVADELSFHNLLSHAKMSGEWFRANDAEVMAFIRRLGSISKTKKLRSSNAAHAIAQYRERHGLTLEAFGRLVGVQKAAVSKWEDGNGPSIENAKEIEVATHGAIPRHVLRPDVWTGEAA